MYETSTGRVVVFLLAWIVAIAGVACQAVAPIGDASRTGGVSSKLTVMVSDFGSERMDATYAGSLDGNQNYARLIHGFLIASNEKSELMPGIASKWSLSSNGLTWTFTIRRGVKFHNGMDLTTDDVLFSLLHAIGPEAFAWNSSTSQLANVSRNMAKIELVDVDTIATTSKTPEPGLANLLSEASTLWVPILPKRAKLNDAQEALAYDKDPIGAGPMKLVKRQAGVSMSFERFDDYYYQPKNGFAQDRRVGVRTLEMLAVPEEATRVASLRGGQADLVSTSVGLKEQVKAGGGRLVYTPEGLTVEARLYGCSDPKYPCRDKRVRQALDYAIDKELIKNKLAGGNEAFSVKGWSIVTPSSTGYTPQLDPRPYDPNMARRLLADAGYPGGAKFGKLIVRTFRSEVPFQVDGAQLAADLWKKELGLDVEVRVVEPDSVDAALKAGELNGQIVWRQNKPRVETQTGIVNFFGDPKSSNALHKDAELFGAVQKTVAILDPDKNVEALKLLYVRLREETYLITSGYLNLAWGVGPRISAWQPFALTRWPSALHTMTVK